MEHPNAHKCVFPQCLPTKIEIESGNSSILYTMKDITAIKV